MSDTTRKLTGTALATTAAMMFAPVASMAAEKEFIMGKSAWVNCMGINACKGQGACKTAENDCKGQNACQGKGRAMLSNTRSCKEAGGTVATKEQLHPSSTGAPAGTQSAD